jgi:hypothetical protein
VSGITVGIAINLIVLAIASSTVNAQATTAVAANSSVTTTLSASQKQQHLVNIQTRGSAEITRRLTSLNTVLGKITSNSKLTVADQTSLVSEVNTEITGLTNLKTQLVADTTLTAAITDAQSIISEYRVYALVLPKIWLVSTADSQQVTEAKLTTLSQNLQSRITSDQQAGLNVASIQSQLDSVNTLVATAQGISSNMEQSVVGLQPSDYNADKTVLSGDLAKLKTANADLKSAYTNDKTIVSALENLKS